MAVSIFLCDEWRYNPYMESMAKSKLWDVRLSSKSKLGQDFLRGLLVWFSNFRNYLSRFSLFLFFPVKLYIKIYYLLTLDITRPLKWPNDHSFTVSSFIILTLSLPLFSQKKKKQCLFLYCRSPPIKVEPFHQLHQREKLNVGHTNTVSGLVAKPWTNKTLILSLSRIIFHYWARLLKIEKNIH